jgi:hypothetical protein
MTDYGYAPDPLAGPTTQAAPTEAPAQGGQRGAFDIPTTATRMPGRLVGAAPTPTLEGRLAALDYPMGHYTGAAQAQMNAPLDPPGRYCYVNQHVFGCKHEVKCICGRTERLPLDLAEGI